MSQNVPALVGHTHLLQFLGREESRKVSPGCRGPEPACLIQTLKHIAGCGRGSRKRLPNALGQSLDRRDHVAHAFLSQETAHDLSFVGRQRGPKLLAYGRRRSHPSKSLLKRMRCGVVPAGRAEEGRPNIGIPAVACLAAGTLPHRLRRLNRNHQSWTRSLDRHANGQELARPLRGVHRTGVRAHGLSKALIEMDFGTLLQELDLILCMPAPFGSSMAAHGTECGFIRNLVPPIFALCLELKKTAVVRTLAIEVAICIGRQ
jgi:hypothetical protein